MNTIGIGHLRGDLRNYVERAATGEMFEIRRRGRPVARLSSAHDVNHMLVPVRLTDLRARVSRIFDRVAAGETIAVEYRGSTVAALYPCVGEAPAKPTRIRAVARRTPVS